MSKHLTRGRVPIPEGQSPSAFARANHPGHYAYFHHDRPGGQAAQRRLRQKARLEEKKNKTEPVTQ